MSNVGPSNLTRNCVSFTHVTAFSNAVSDAEICHDVNRSVGYGDVRFLTTRRLPSFEFPNNDVGDLTESAKNTVKARARGAHTLRASLCLKSFIIV